VRIARDKELYYYTTNDGQACYDATAKLIDTHGKTKDGAWIGYGNLGPGRDGELYQIGIRPLNEWGPGATEHEPFDEANGEHLGYMHIACRRTDTALQWWYDFSVKISNWDDGNYGKSIKEEADRCEKALGTDHWKYEAEREDRDGAHTFVDGSKSDHWASWRLAMTIPERCGEKAVEKVLGLKEGTFKCPASKEYHEVDMFST